VFYRLMLNLRVYSLLMENSEFLNIHSKFLQRNATGSFLVRKSEPHIVQWSNKPSGNYQNLFFHNHESSLFLGDLF